MKSKILSCVCLLLPLYSLIAQSCPVGNGNAYGSLSPNVGETHTYGFSCPAACSSGFQSGCLSFVGPWTGTVIVDGTTYSSPGNPSGSKCNLGPIDSQFSITFVSEVHDLLLSWETDAMCPDGPVILELGPINTIPLPVTILSFDGNIVDGVPQLKWTTEKEYQVSHYEVERKVEDNEYQTVAQVFSISNSEANTYQFIDEKPSNGLNTYRLKSVDLDGSFEYHTNAVELNYSSLQIFSVFPSPCKYQFSLDLVYPNAVSLVQVRDYLGRAVYTERIAAEDTESHTIDCSLWSCGLYDVRVTQNGRSQNQKIVIE